MSNNMFERKERILRFAVEKGDSSIFTMIRNGEKFVEPFEETMEKIIYQLAKEKSDIFNVYQSEMALRPTGRKKL